MTTEKKEAKCHVSMGKVSMEQAVKLGKLLKKDLPIGEFVDECLKIGVSPNIEFKFLSERKEETK